MTPNTTIDYNGEQQCGNNNSSSSSSSSHNDHAEDIIREDKRGMDPNAVEEMLTKEMLSLSVKDRNDIQEEIHGVKCLAVEESSELIERSLKEMARELDEIIPDHKKKAYLRSKNRPPEEKEQSEKERTQRMLEELQLKLQKEFLGTSTVDVVNGVKNSVAGTGIGAADVDVAVAVAVAVGPLHKQQQQQQQQQNQNQNQSPYSTYIHGDDFRLRFLRCDCFDVSKAATRLVNYLELLVDLFGDYALRRPICLSDFTKEELRHMRKGMIQLLPYRDRSGRRIVIFFPEEEISQVPPFTKAKIAMYMGWVAGYNDVVTQRKGLIVMAWFDKSFVERNQSWKIKYKFYEMVSTRISAIHFCSPDTPHYRFRRAIGTMRCGDEYRSKIMFHLGESVEVHYKLQGYGIPTEHVPISWTGKIKIQNLKQWMRIRKSIEEEQKQHHPGNNQAINNNNGNNTNHDDDNNNNNCTNNSSDDTYSSCSIPASSILCAIIECPQFDDVVFRQGTSGICHPGNVTFRSLIESILLQEEERRRAHFRVEQMLQCQSRCHYSKTKIKTSSGNSSSAPASKKKKKFKIKRPKQLALDIYQERERTDTNKNGRYLLWNNDKGWWNEITDREHILMKIEYMVRGFQKHSLNYTNKSTSSFPSPSSSSEKKSKGTTSGRTHKTKIQKIQGCINLQSETTLFRAQDGAPLTGSRLCSFKPDYGYHYDYDNFDDNDNDNDNTKRRRLNIFTAASLGTSQYDDGDYETMKTKEDASRGMLLHGVFGAPFLA